MAALAALVAACNTSRSVEETATVSDCARCHGYPPPPYATSTGSNHPANADCHLCHPGTVEPDNVTIVPGGQHMDGVVEVAGGHPAGYADPLQHGPDALAFLGGDAALACTQCHGDDYAGGTSGRSCTDCHTAASPAPGFADWQTNCTFCHGTPTPSWTSPLALAAPPQAVAGTGDQTSANPKVGAHQAHLAAGTYAAAFPCSSCHVVPDAPSTPLAPGAQHFRGTGAQAAIAFSVTASKGVTSAAYAGAGGACAVYCHGSGTQFTNPAGKVSAAWTTTGIACGDCHGLPPDSGPTYLAPNAHQYHLTAGATCAGCHHGYTATTVDTAVHVDGKKDVVVVKASDSSLVTIAGWDCATCHDAIGIPPASHPVPYPAHTTDALANIASCAGCHGSDYGGGLSGLAPSCNGCHAAQVPESAPDWKANCTFCHGTRTANVTTATSASAPPVAVDRSTDAAKVGAHQAHLAQGAYANALPCSSCHPVPTAAQALTHFTGGAATVAFSALASQGVSSPAYAGSGGACTVYCHGSGNNVTGGANKAIAWSATGIACDACHTSTPTSGYHTQHRTSYGVSCDKCHPGYSVGAPGTVDLSRHVNGTLEAQPTLLNGAVLSAWPSSCNGCH